MRDILILATILGSMPIAFFNPYYGMLVWVWIAYFNPHRYAWGITYNFPVAIAIAVPTLGGLLFTKEMNRKFLVRESVVLLLLWAWFGVSIFHASMTPEFSQHVADGMMSYKNISKILLMTFVMILLVTSQMRLRYLMIVTALSFGIRAIPATLFGIQTGGKFRVWGPPESFVADNNAFGLALNMALPMLFFLAHEEKSRMFRIFLRVCFVCTIVSSVLTYSRGALLGLAAVLAAIALKANRKLISAAFVTLCAVVLLTYAPERWVDRMKPLVEGRLDESAQQRLIAWHVAWGIAQDYPITGAGLGGIPDVNLFQHYQNEPLPGGFLSSGPHSIYFQMLGEHGFVGLGLFLFLLGSCIWSLRQMRRQSRGHPDSHWVNSYSHMIEASLLAYMVSGAFLGFAYFDLFFQLVAMVTVMKLILRKEALQRAEEHPAPAVHAEVEEVVPA
jgi:probable O-glycosylation ligase (exosortase A-associated)